MFKIVAEKKIEYELGGGCKLERFWFRDLIEHLCFKFILKFDLNV